MMTYSQPSYYYDHSSTLPKGQTSKLAEHRYYGSPSSTSSHGSYSMTGSSAHPRTLPPYISVHRASEPASPATVATTISSHSTPSPSPSRNSNMPNTTGAGADFTLFDDAIIAAAQDLNDGNVKGRSPLDASTTMADTSSMSNYATSSFPLIVPHDGSYSNYAPSGLYGNYSSSYSAPDTAASLYNIAAEQQSLPQSQSQSHKFLRPSSYNTNDSSISNSYSHQSHNDVEAIENVPDLSPTSRQRISSSPARSKSTQAPQPKSPRGHLDQGSRPNYASASSAACEENRSSIHSWLDEYLRKSSDLHSAMPKLGRTFSDAVQDELYNPDLIGSHSKSVPVKPENKSALPRIFQEAQQQHQQDFSQVAPHAQINRDRSPFRNNSPYHPTNHSFGVPYGSNGSLQQQGFDQNQIAMALALREQMRKEAEQATVAPKTISPRDAILDYNEPDSRHNQMSLFPPLPNGRMLPPQDDAISNGSIHHSSQDGSDLDDYHSMATSRRASMANSSVSSHLDVPRFNYMHQQPSYDSLAASQYYYDNAHNLTNSLPINDNSNIPYIKEEMDYAPIQRPADVSANSGTYTCTFTGCGQRFTTSTKLQKHRREAHRKSAPTGNSVSTAAAIASRNAQPGPHRCMRVNPSTSKPCNTVFSRPYDLTRHEDTIHNSAKEKVRCEICNDEKTFSRPDALVRHRRVKHGIH